MTTPDPTPAQLEELNNWLRGVDDRTQEQLKADLRAMGDGTHPRPCAEQRIHVHNLPDRIVVHGGVL